MNKTFPRRCLLDGRVYLTATFLFLATAITSSGCSGAEEGANDGTNGEDNPSTEVCDALPVFQQNCAGSICHGTGDGMPASGGVDLVMPGVAARLLDVPATYPGLACAPPTPELLLNSADPPASLMYLKLTNTQTCGDGMPSPSNLVALEQADLECILSWMQGVIEGDVPLDGGTTGTGGAAATGGAAGTGGTTAAGGAATGGAATGGTTAAGGASSGGAVGTGGTTP